MHIKSFLKNKIIFCVAIFAISLFFFGCNIVDAATLQINSNSSTLSPGDTTTLHVVVNTDGVAINNAESAINFPTDLVSVISVSKSNSIFSLWVEDPAFSNSTGIITFNGGLPTPGFMGVQGSVLSIVVKAKKAGQASFTFSGAAVRANDGLGTDVLSNQSGKVITIVEKEAPAIVAPTVSPSTSSGPALQISSLTHPNQDQWYKDNSPVFQWVVPTGSDEVQTTIDNNISGVPHVTYSPAISEKTVKDLKDGVWYFKIRARTDGVWGPISTYITRIDTTAPQEGNVAFSYDEKVKNLNINADIQDITSGIDHYDIYIDGTLAKTVSAKDFVNGSYSFAFNASGDHAVKLVVVDRAGNSVESSGNFHVANVVSPQIEPASQTAPSGEPSFITIGSFAFDTSYFMLLIILIVILLVICAYYLGRRHSRPQHSLKIRTPMVKGDDYKILLMLKKRLEKHLEILQHTRHDRILTKEEKEIKEAIEGDLDEVDRAIEEQK